MTLYRSCRGVDDAGLEHALSSNFQARREPPHSADLRATVLYMAVSMFDRPTVLEKMARKSRGRNGTYIARLELEPGHGFCIADTGSAGHWSVWGVPAELAKTVTEVWEVTI